MSKIHDFLAKNLGVEATLETAAAWFADRDRVDLEFTAPQVAYILKNFDPKRECYHMHVRIHSRMTARETHYEPAEYEYRAWCMDCATWLELEDVPEVASGRGA